MQPIIRWMVRSDTQAVLHIEDLRFKAHALSEEELVSILSHRSAIGMVIEHEAEIVGYMIYLLMKGELFLRRIAVLHLRNGYGMALMDRLKQKLERDNMRRKKITLMVPETYLGAQLFAKANGFVCKEIAAGWFDGDSFEQTEDGYFFEWCLPRAVCA